jgi:TatD DNase family protein
LRALDAHAHLDDPKLTPDLDAVVERARAAGLERILSCGQDLGSSEATIAIAKRHPLVRVAVGVHPHRAASWSDETAARLRALARDDRVVAIGEIGVDLSGRSAPRDAQVIALEAQLRLARELALPAVVHVRDAGDLAREIVDRVGGVRGMIHCYSEGLDEVRGWIDRGFAISFAGTVTYPRSDALRRAAALVPATALLVETDAPYLPPQGRRGQRNEPAYVVETLAVVAEARGLTAAECGQAVAENAARLFGPRWGTT